MVFPHYFNCLFVNRFITLDNTLSQIVCVCVCVQEKKEKAAKG